MLAIHETTRNVTRAVKRSLVIAIISVFAVASGPLLRAESAEKGLEPIRIARGERVDIKEYLVAGRTVIFDFTSRYCPPCEAIAPYLHKLHALRDNIVVVEVDINRPNHRGIDWGSPVARQYGLRSVPHFKVFDPDGELKAEADAAYEIVVEWIKEYVVSEEG